MCGMPERVSEANRPSITKNKNAVEPHIISLRDRQPVGARVMAVESYGFDGIFQLWPQIGLEEKPDMKFLENCLISQASVGHLHVILMKI